MSNRSVPLILCIDDDEDARNLLLYLLKHDNYEVKTAADGRQGIKFATAYQPDIILLDVEMPGMNGYEVCLQLQRDPITSFIPIVFLTVHGSEQDRRRAFAAGAADFLTKPFQLKPLLDKIQRQLERRANWQQLKELQAAPVSPSKLFIQFKNMVARKYDFSPDRYEQWLKVQPLQLYAKAFDFGFTHQELAQAVAEFLNVPYTGHIVPGTVRLGVLPSSFTKEHLIVAVDEVRSTLNFILSNPFDASVHDAMNKCTAPGGAARFAVTEPGTISVLLERQPNDVGPPNPGISSPQEPLHRDKGSEAPSPLVAAGTAGKHTTSILVVDDDPDAQVLVQRILASEGYEVTVAADGIDALILLEKRRFDLVISDVALPNLDGLKLLRIMREKNLGMPVLLVTGLPGQDNEIRGLKLGAEDYIRKPLNKEILLLKLKKILRQRSPGSKER